MHAIGTVVTRAARRSRRASVWCVLGCVLFGCATRAPVHDVSQSPITETAMTPVVTRGEFTIHAGKLDTWNAVGQIVVRTNGATYVSRAQMLDLYSVRYHDQPFLLVTRAQLLSDAIKETTTLVTARTLNGKPIDSDASAELLALLQRDLPAEIQRVRATQAAEANAKQTKVAKPKSKRRKK